MRTRSGLSELTGREIEHLRTLCKEKAESTGMTDHKEILRAVMRDMTPRKTGAEFRRPPRTLKHRLAAIEDVLPDVGVEARKHRRHRQALERGVRRRASQAGATIEPVNRDRVIERDNSTCHICGLMCKPQEIHLDHVIPLARGGAHSEDNLKVACSTCNRRKGTLLLAELPVRVRTADG